MHLPGRRMEIKNEELKMKAALYGINPNETMEFKPPKLTLSNQTSYGRVGLHGWHSYLHAFEVHEAI